jgi:hypothetical protein
MSFVKYATADILEVKTSKTKIPFEYGAEPGSTFQKFAALEDTKENDGYLYIRTRSISSRVNKNNDGWPAEELAKSYKTFVGRPLFVDHNNDDPKRTRGVILDARLFVDEDKTSALDPYYSNAPAAHLPPTHIETIAEVDARSFPKLAKAIREGKIDSVSMGANIEKSVCSVCNNEATTPQHYCSHIKAKGNEFEVEGSNGEKMRKKAYEDCYGVNFFEQSFVFDPADETALFRDKPSDKELKFSAKEAAGEKTDVNQPGDEDKVDDIKNKFPKTKKPQSESVTAPERVDTLSNDLICPNCESDNLSEDPDGIYRCPTCEYELPPEEFRAPDLEEAREMDIKQKVEQKPNEDGELETETDEDNLDSEGVEFEDDKQKKQSPVRPVAPLSKTINTNISNGIINEMNWNTTPQNVDFIARYLGSLSRKSSSVADLQNENKVARLLINSYGRDKLAPYNITRLDIAEAIEKFANELDLDDDDDQVEFIRSKKTAGSGTFDMPTNGVHAWSLKVFKVLGFHGSLTYHNVPAEFAAKLPNLPFPGITVAGQDVTINLNEVPAQVGQAVGMEIAKAAGADKTNYNTYEVSVTLDMDGDDQDLSLMEDMFKNRSEGPVWEPIYTLCNDFTENHDPSVKDQAVALYQEHKNGGAVTSAVAPKPVVRKAIEPKPRVKSKDEKIVRDQLKPVEADRRVIKREEKDEESGVTRSEQIVEETGDIGSLQSEESEQPKAESEDTTANNTDSTPKAESQETDTEESKDESETSRPWERKKEPAYASASESKLLLAMEVAKLASSLGVISANEELNYAAELESKSEEVVRDRKEFLEKLKTSGVLNKTARFKDVPQVPRLGNVSSNGHSEEGKQDVVDYLSEVFL